MSQKAERKYILNRFVVGPLEVNSYIAADPVTKEAFLIDPGAEPDKLKRFLKENGLDLKFIVNTHGHADHTASDGYFDCPVYIHTLDKDFLTDPSLNLSGAFGFPLILKKEARLMEDGDEIEIGSLKIEIIHTPGHTPGSVSIRLNGAIFTGDALFHNSIGRTDFPYGDERLLLESIRRRILVFSEETEIYPGHGEPSTIGEEKRTNPFL